MRVVHAHFRIDDPKRRCSSGCSQWRRRRAEGASEAKPTLEQPAHYLELGRPIIGQHRASWMPYAAYCVRIPCPRI
jgi:hypothetical protein